MLKWIQFIQNKLLLHSLILWLRKMCSLVYEIAKVNVRWNWILQLFALLFSVLTDKLFVRGRVGGNLFWLERRKLPFASDLFKKKIQNSFTYHNLDIFDINCLLLSRVSFISYNVNSILCPSCGCKLVPLCSTHHFTWRLVTQCGITFSEITIVFFTNMNSFLHLPRQ